MVKNLPASEGDARDAVLSVGREDPRRRKRQLNPVFLPGKSHGWRSLAGVHRVTKSRTRLRDFTLYTYMHDIYFKRKQWIAS